MFERLAIVAIGFWTVAAGLLGCQAIMLALEHWWPAITIGTIWWGLSIPGFWPMTLLFPIPLTLLFFAVGCVLLIAGILIERARHRPDSLAASE